MDQSRGCRQHLRRKRISPHAAIADLSSLEGMKAFKIPILSASMTTRARNKRLGAGLIGADDGIQCSAPVLAIPDGLGAV